MKRVETSGGGERFRILLVEDSPSDRKLIEDALKTQSLEVSGVTRLADGLRRLAEPERFDAVLLDLALPDSSGFETFQSVREARPELPIIILSGSVDDRLAVKAVAHGAQDYISKDFIAPPLLLKTIRYAIARSQIALLEKRQFQAEKEKAEAIARVKSEFLATMSHEIRTPLNGVIGMTSLLGETPLTEEQAEYVRAIRGSGEVLLGMISEILDHSKLEAGKMELEEVEFDLRHALEETLELFVEQAGRKGLVLSDVVDPRVPCLVKGDPTRLRQVLGNLVSNAIKFTERGEVLVRIGWVGECEGRVRLRFEISDSGIGITPEAQRSLFEPFSQADLSTTRRFGGTGLGLSIVRRLVALMGGEVRLSSRPGEGSCFTFELAMVQSPDGRKFAPRPDLRGKRVRLEIDDSTVRRRLVEHLTLRGMCPAAPSEPFDIVIADDRRDSCASARIAISLPDRSAPGEEILRAPFRQAELYRKIAALLGDERARLEDPDATPNTTPASPTRAASPVLVVDDNELNCHLTKRMLEKLGLRADVASNGRQALECVRRGRYSLVLLDCLMPELDGFETARAIRNEEMGALRLPVIALTANALAGEAEKCLAAGMDDFLTKPITIERLQKALDRWLPARGLQAPRVPEARQADRPSALDEKTLRGLRQLGQSEEDDPFFAEILDLFLEHAPPLLPELRRALERRDAVTVKLLAHRLRGFCGNIGALRMQSCCAGIEERSREGDLAPVPALLRELETELGAVRDAIARERRRPCG